jgi:hypothetical protein
MGSLDRNTEEALVLVYDAPDQTTSELVCASLQSSGIRAVVQNKYVGGAAGMLNYLGLTDSRGVLVPASEADAARALLADQQPTEDELAAEAEADTMTLEEAEARVK